MYRTLDSGTHLNYKKAFTTSPNAPLAFDETPGMDSIIRDNGVPMYDMIDDITVFQNKGDYFKGSGGAGVQVIKNIYFEWDNGKVFAMLHGNKIAEFAYLHLRNKGDLKINIDFKKPVPEKLFLFPTGILTSEESDEFTKYKRMPFKIFYFRTRHKIRRVATKIFLDFFPRRIINFAMKIRRSYLRKYLK